MCITTMPAVKSMFFHHLPSYLHFMPIFFSPVLLLSSFMQGGLHFSSRRAIVESKQKHQWYLSFSHLEGWVTLHLSLDTMFYSKPPSSYFTTSMSPPVQYTHARAPRRTSSPPPNVVLSCPTSPSPSHGISFISRQLSSTLKLLCEPPSWSPKVRRQSFATRNRNAPLAPGHCVSALYAH